MGEWSALTRQPSSIVIFLRCANIGARILGSADELDFGYRSAGTGHRDSAANRTGRPTKLIGDGTAHAATRVQLKPSKQSEVRRKFRCQSENRNG